MKIREVAKRAGVSHQAIYKKLKARGKTAEDITDKATGELTPEGLALILELYPQAAIEQPQDATAQPSTDEKTVATLREEVQRLSNELRNANDKIVALTEERDFLREVVAQKQEMETLRTKLELVEASQKAAQAQAITDGSDGSGSGKRRGLWARLRGKG